MSTPLANPRRTKLMAWPSKQGVDEQETEQATATADSVSTTATEEETAAAH